METERKKGFIPKLFAAVFGIVCLLITGVVGYIFTFESSSSLMVMDSVILVFIMWMSYVGVFLDISNM